MGTVTSQQRRRHAVNDFQLVCECSKELEFLLTSEFEAHGRGLHECISSIESKLPATTVTSLRLVATARNRLVHDRNVQQLERREEFVAHFESALEELRVVLAQRDLPARS